MIERLQSIRPRLEELARLDPGCKLFGSREHRYQLAPPLVEDEVATFELLHGVRLPEDYRLFLLEVGSEGAGPHYGLYALGNFDHAEDPPLLTDNFLASPFPHQRRFNLLDEYRRRYSSDEERVAQWNAFQEETFDIKWVYGTLCLGHEGCGIYDILVVSSEQRGCIWVDDRCNDGGLSPLEPTLNVAHPNLKFTRVESARTSFLNWYEWWLDSSLLQANNLNAS